MGLRLGFRYRAVAQWRSNPSAADLAAHRSDLDLTPTGGRPGWIHTWNFVFTGLILKTSLQKPYGFNIQSIQTWGLDMNVPKHSFREIWSPKHTHTHEMAISTLQDLASNVFQEFHVDFSGVSRWINGGQGWPIGADKIIISLVYSWRCAGLTNKKFIEHGYLTKNYHYILWSS